MNLGDIKLFIKWLKYPTATFTELKQGVDKDLKKTS